MNDITRMHKTDSFTDLHHVQFTQTFSQDEPIIDDTFE